MSDWAENVARADAQRLPPSDYGSTRAIQNVAALLRATYQRGRDEVEVQECRPLRASLAAATAREERLREALEGLDAAYCRAGSSLTREERTEDRKRLIAARVALKDPAP